MKSLETHQTICQKVHYLATQVEKVVHTLRIPLYSELGWWLKIENPGHTRVSNQDTFFEV